MIVRRQPHPSPARDGWQESGHETGHRVDPASAVAPRRLADQKRLAGAQGSSQSHASDHEFYLERGYVVVTEHELRGSQRWLPTPTPRGPKGSTISTAGEVSSTCGGIRESRPDA